VLTSVIEGKICIYIYIYIYIYTYTHAVLVTTVLLLTLPFSTVRTHISSATNFATINLPTVCASAVLITLHQQICLQYEQI